MCLVNVCMHAPRSTSHNRTVESNDALMVNLSIIMLTIDYNAIVYLTYLASIRFMFGLAVPGPVGLHLIVYISLLCACKSCTQVSCFIDHIFKVMSSEHEANRFP